MRSETRLDSVVFQLTPTRTRFDLVIISNNKKEKLASGLLNPFLAHLKTAKDQIDKGGYSIILEPDPQVGAAWFTKVTVERFVRFVSQPEVLERVTTIESEILQIENAIAIQGNDNFGLRSVADQPIKPIESIRGMKTSVDIDAEKAIVLYKPGSQPNLPELNGSITQENSKVQLLRVLETRKMILRKEQGMAFARAEAAGFDMDKLVDLISFAESFGASRLKEACIGLMELWKKKHDTGQWLEVEAAAAMSIQPEFSTLNASGIVFAAEAVPQKDYVDPRSLSGGDMVLDIDGKSDKHLPEDAQVPVGHQEHFHGQFQQPTYPQWPLPPPPGHPGFQSYTVQGMPCYQNYPGNIPYFHPPYHSAEDPKFSSSHRKVSKRQSMDDKHTDTRGRNTRSHDDTDQNTSDSDKDGSHGHKSHRRVVKSGKKKSNIVVPPNLNDIRSKKHGESESQSTSEAEAEDLQSDMQERKHKHFAETSKNEVVGQIKTAQYSDAYSNDKVADGEETDSGNWQAFQKFLLRAEEKSRRVEESMFAGGKEPPRRNQIRDEADMTCPSEYGDSCDRTMGFDLANGKPTRMKQEAFEDPLLVSHNGRVSVDRHFKEIENKGVYRRMGDDEFLVNGKEKQFNSMRYSSPYTDHAYVHDAITSKNSSNDIPDESFVLPHRSVSRDIGSDITAIHMDSEFSLSFSKAQESSNKIKSHISYEPEDVSLVTERGREMLSIQHHPATDFDFRNPVRNSVKLQVPNPENPSINPKVNKLDKDKFKASKDSVEKMRKDALLKKSSSSSRLNPLTEAQKRAEKLRSYKADLQKVKREREEEERKRLEALKRERQKRIAARSNAATTKLPLTAQQTKARSLTKTLPNPYKSSKFSDSDPANSSLLHKFPLRTSSTGAIVSQKAIKPSRLNGSKHGIIRSTSSLPVSRKQGLMAEAKADSLRMKRLSDPKSSYNQHPSLVKSVSANRFHKQSLPDESQKKITAIMQLDKRKTATLPELKIQTPKTSDRIGKESTSKGSMQKGTGSKPPQTFRCSKEKLSSDNQPSNSDENLVIEKTVVMLENNVVTALVASQGGKMLDTKERSHGNESDRGYTMIHPPSSSLVIAKLEGAGKLDGKLSSFEVVSHSRNGHQKFSKLTEPEKSYQVPYARGPSLDDPVGTHSGNGGKTVQESVTSFEKLTLGNHLETCEEPVSQEKKGFRKLLKFGRKRHNLGEGTDGSDVSSVDEQTVATGSPNAGNLLKNLISQDGNHTGSTPCKVSRSFSLLSPFRNKSSDNKHAEHKPTALNFTK